MQTVNIHEAKTNLSRLLKEVQQGKHFVIAKVGRPIARVTGIDAPESRRTRRMGFLAGQIQVPEDFDRIGEQEIIFIFGENDAPAS